MSGTLKTLTNTPIGQAIKADNVQLLKELIATDNILFKDEKQNTYLHFTATMYKPQTFHIVASSGIEVSAQNKHGNTALHNSALQNELGHVLDLMTSGIDPFLKNSLGMTAAEVPGKSKKWMKLYSIYDPGIIRAIENHDLKRVEYLIQNWCRIDIAAKDQPTLRLFAASFCFYDIVKLLDRYKSSLDMICGILEHDRPRVHAAVQRGACNLNFVKQTNRRTHPLQLAIQQHEDDFCRWLCKPRFDEIKPADVNMLVHVKDYFKGPLFFEGVTLRGCPTNKRHNMMRTLMEANADMRAKDERGRTFAIYLVDALPEDEAIPFLITAFQELGASLSDREEFGLTARNIAELQRKTKVVEFLDSEVVRHIRDNNVSLLKELAQEGYVDFFFELGCRETRIYAQGNSTEEVMECLDWIVKFQDTVAQLHFLICEDADDMELFRMMRMSVDAADMLALLRARDRGGRCSLHLAVLHERLSVVQFIVRRDPVTMSIYDNMGRKALHYACCSSTPFLEQILLGFGDEDEADVFWRTASEYAEEIDNKEINFLSKEKQQEHGFPRTLKYVRIYEKIISIMDEEDFEASHKFKLIRRVLEQDNVNLKSLEAELKPSQINFMCDFRDLAVLAVEKCQHHILKLFIFHGADLNKVRKVRLPGQAELQMLTIRQCAQFCGWSHVCDYINSASKNHIFPPPTSQKLARCI